MKQGGCESEVGGRRREEKATKYRTTKRGKVELSN